MKKAKNRKNIYYSKATSAILVVSVIATPLVSVEASGLSDMKPGQYFYEDVMNLQERGIISGHSDGTFKPNQLVTRGQAAKMIAGVLQLNTTAVNNPNFKDIDSTHQYYGAIAALKQAGIIDGYEDDTFRPNETIQRNHVAKIIAGALNLRASNASKLPFTDVGATYKEAIAALYEHGVTTGKTTTTFAGSAAVTRGQLAAFIVRAEKAALGNPLTPTPAAKEELVTISNLVYSGNTLTANEKQYTISAAAAPIFTAGNKAALKGATLVVKVKNGVIESVEEVTLRQAGTTEQPVIFSATAAVKKLQVHASYVTLKNIQVAQDLIIAGASGGTIKLEKVAVKGKLIVNDGLPGAVASLDNRFANTGEGPDITMQDSDINAIDVNADGTSIESNTVIARVVLSADVALFHYDGSISVITVSASVDVIITGTGNIGEVIVDTVNQLALELDGLINLVTVLFAEASLVLGAGVTVDAVGLPEGVTLQNVLENYAGSLNQVLGLLINNQIQPPPSSGSGGGGGSSGGGGGDSAPDTSALDAAKAGLTNTINAAKNKQLDETLYTAESVEAFKSARDNAIASAENVVATATTVTAIEQAVTAFNAAMQAATALLEEELSGLELYKKKLADLIAGVETIDQSQYTPASVAAYTTSRDAAIVLAQNVIDTETEAENVERAINAFTGALMDALGLLIEATEEPPEQSTLQNYKDMLAERMAAVEEIDESLYTPESVTAYNEALGAAIQAAQNVIDTETEAENVERAINAFTGALMDALGLLIEATEEPPEQSTLQNYKDMLAERMAAVEEIDESLYTPESVTAYNEARDAAIEAAQTVIANETDAENVERAINAFDVAITDAIGLLEESILSHYKNMLAERIAAVEEIDESLYTPESVTAYNEARDAAIEAAQSVIANETDAENVERAINAFDVAITDAIGLLEESILSHYKNMLAERMAAVEEIDESLYTPESVTAYNEALGAAIQAAQNVIDTETEAENVERAINAFTGAIMDALGLLQTTIDLDHSIRITQNGGLTFTESITVSVLTDDMIEATSAILTPSINDVFILTFDEGMQMERFNTTFELTIDTMIYTIEYDEMEHSWTLS